MMKLRYVLFLLLTAMLIGGQGAAPRVHAVDNHGLLLEWAAPPFQLSTIVGDDGRTYTHVEVAAEGYLNYGPPGWPSLPRQGSLIALPPSGDFGLELPQVEYETVPLEHPVEPASAPAPLRLDAGGEPLPAPRLFALDEAAYSGARPFPVAPVTLGDAVWMRDHRLARLVFTPFRYDPSRNALEVVRRVRLRVWWQLPAGAALAATGDLPFDDVLANVVLNPLDLDRFRSQDRTQALEAPDASALEGSISRDQRASASQSYKLLVTTEGIYALDGTTLAAAGLPVASINPATLRLVHHGIEVATRWEGDGDAAFETGERLLFYAQPQLTRYAGHDVYWLSWGGAAGQRMGQRSGAPSGLSAGAAWTTTQAEENAGYDSRFADHSGDHWFWRGLKRPDATSDMFEMALETPSPGATGELTIWLQGTESAPPNPDHHVRLSVNGTHVGDAWWEGKTPHTATISLPAGLLHNGSNSVGLSLPGDTGSPVEANWVDAFAIAYELGSVSEDVAHFHGQSTPNRYAVGGFSAGPLHVYDVTDPHAPQIVTGFTVAGGQVSVGDGARTPAEYLILAEDRISAPEAIVPAKSLSDPLDGADYLIVTHPDFQAALAPLAAHRAAQGLRVGTADVEAIYDQYGDGRMDPVAIRTFLSHAYANWPGPALQYVLLVGDATYDPRHYMPDTNPTFLPAYLADVDPELGETASDNRYADLTGDPLPELRLGRFPVNTQLEAQAIVDKIISYEADPLPGRWNGRLVFGADNPSTAGNHRAHADAEFTTYATPEFERVGARVYLSETPGPPHWYTDGEAAQDALIEELNQGALLYTFFGHASWHQQAVLETDNFAPLFHVDHIARLTNFRRWPVVLQMTCLTGRYTHRTSNTLDESLLRTRDAGAVAVWGASGNGVATGHKLLHRIIYRTVFDGAQTELGAAIHPALAQLYAAGSYLDLIETYHLFGDPALKLNTDLPFSVFLPIIGQTQ